MKWEIEKKFLVKGDSYKRAPFQHVTQGYLSEDKNRTIRIRIADNQGWLTIKGKSEGIKRIEFEYKIPGDDAMELLKLSLHQPIKKTRYLYEYKNNLFEVDEFHAANQGLVLCEIELKNESEQFDRPDFLGEEVSHDPRYYNLSLSITPFSTWKS